MRFSIFVSFLFCANCFAQIFESIPESYSGIRFKNSLVETQEENIISYEYFFNGGGVGAGDLNNDGLTDLIFISNQEDPHIYLNQGDLQFIEISKKAGLSNLRGWKTGVAIADVNNDGWLDIYISYSGKYPPNRRRNKLFINQKNLTFKEEAEKYGIDDSGFTSHSAFLDYDNDGDLDLFVLNHNTKYFRNFDAAYVKKQLDIDAGDRLYENIGNRFQDITIKAGILSNPIGYGLGISVSDFNNDGWSDIYITNDYVEEDYLYINNQNGTFTDKLKSQIPTISNFSMGVDAGDINNDGFVDLVTLDMLPEDNRRQKLLYAPDNFEVYNNMVENGFHHQSMRNMLHLNNGDDSFSEIGQIAGISSTDWSWAPLLADFNNDGLLDLFITNGYGRDMINRDIMKFYVDERMKYEQGNSNEKLLIALKGIPSTPLKNYLFLNKGNGLFEDESEKNGVYESDFSHGAIYSDLDNDGDLDIVVNRMNEVAKFYKNRTVEAGINTSNYLKVKLNQGKRNQYGIGSRIKVYLNNGVNIIRDISATHGFQSSMIEPLHFGLGNALPDSIQVNWNDGSVQIFKENMNVNSLVEIKKSGSFEIKRTSNTTSHFQYDTISYKHEELLVNDFKVQPLLPYMISYHGPKLKSIDINQDGLDDLFMGGSEGIAPQILLQSLDGRFFKSRQPFLEDSLKYEDTDACFFDADNDGDLDLYVVSGGFANEGSELPLDDRFYLNNNGLFTPKNSIPEDQLVGSVVTSWDFDNDGDLDLFIGTRVKQGKFPEPERSLLYMNNGLGEFQSANYSFLSELGLIKDAIVEDFNDDGFAELIVIGDWERPRVFSFIEGDIIEKTENFFEKDYFGWWNKIVSKDLDKDGDLDLIVGNWGLNNLFKASPFEPMELVYGDFDNNGFIDPIWSYHILGKLYPNVLRDEITDQLVYLRKRFVTYESYSEATLDQILTKEDLRNSSKKTTNILETVWFENKNGKFVMRKLPIEANYSSTFSILAEDIDLDGNIDLLLGGNTSFNRVRLGKQQSSYGIFLKGDGYGNFKYIPNKDLNLKIVGDVRSMLYIKTLRTNKIVVGINDQFPLIMEYRNELKNE